MRRRSRPRKQDTHTTNTHNIAQEYFDWAKPLEESAPVQRLRALARELRVVLPVSFFERAHNAHFNSLAMIDADGSVLPGIYRKSHIPDGPG